jgi:uncharacterized delta-60 repeat protein
MKKWNFWILCLMLCFNAVAQDGSLNTGFTQTGIGFNNNDVNAVARQADGKIVVGGVFSLYNGVTHKSLMRFNSDGSLDGSFASVGTGLNNVVTSVVIQPDGKILIGGGFSTYQGATRNFIARLTSDGNLDPSFNQTGTGLGNGAVQSIALQTDGKIVVGGFFTNYNGVSHKNLARLNSDGSIDESFAEVGTGLDGPTVYAVAVQPDGKILAAGNFNNYNGVASIRLARFNTDGTLDGSFPMSGATFGSVIQSIALQSDGKVVVGGTFTQINGTARKNVARINANGITDLSFNNTGTGFNAKVFVVLAQPDGKILVGGDFASYNATSRPFVARLNSNGSLDAGYVQTGTGLNSSVLSLLLQPDGNIMAGGAFTSYNGTAASKVARLNNTVISISTGTISSTTYCSGAAVQVPYTIAGSFITGNVFTAQLSNASGSFASPVVIGSVTSTAAGTIAATIPANTGSGTGYRIRVVSSNIAITGSDNGSDIVINPLTPATISYPGSPYFTGPGSATVTLTGTTGGTFGATPAGLSIDANTGTIDLATSLPGTYNVSYIVASGIGCGLYTTNASVTLASSFSATISYTGSPFCTNKGVGAVTVAGTTGGSFSSAPAGLSIDASNGEINLASSLAGTYTVTYGLYGSSTNALVIVRPVSGFTSPANQVLCNGSSTAPINFAATSGLSIMWTNSDPSIGLSASGIGNIANFTAQNAGISTVSANINFSTSGGTECVFRGATRITVKPTPSLAAVSGQIVCAGTTTAPVVFSSLVAATVSSWTNNNIAVGLNAAGTGNIPSFTVVNNTGVQQTATITATPVASGCPGTPIQFTIASSPSVQSISYAGSPYCQSGPAYPTRAGSAGGTYSATPAGLLLNTSTGQVNLALSAPGTYTISYSVAAAGGCPGIASTQLQILPQASLAPVPNQVFCNGIITAPVVFSGTATTYNWTNDNPAIGLAASGSGTSLPSFTTVNAGPGVQYAYIRVVPQGNSSIQCPGKIAAFRIAVNYCGPIAHHDETSGGNGNTRMSAVMMISPNPASASATISVTESGSYLLQVISRVGTPVGNARTFTGNRTQVDLSNLLPGSYVIRITNTLTGEVRQQQLIKL